MNKEEFRADHFKSIEELLDTIETWLINEEQYGTLYDDFYRFFDAGAMEEMYYYIKQLQNRVDEVTKICLAKQKYISDCETKIVILEKQLEFKKTAEETEQSERV